MATIADIRDVTMYIDGETYIFDVISTENLLSSTKICLSKSSGTSDVDKISCETKQWIGVSGIAEAAVSDINNLADLYIYLKSAGGERSSRVRLFITQPKLRKFKLTDENSLSLSLKKDGKNANPITKYLVRFNNQGKVCPMVYQNEKIDLPTYLIYEEDEKVEVSIAYFSCNEGVNVNGVFSDKVSIPLKGPGITSSHFDFPSLSVTFEGDFRENIPVEAEILCRGIQVATTEVVEKTAELPMQLDPAESYELRLYYKTEYGHSLKSKIVPVMFDRPIVTSCVFDNTNATVKLGAEAYYRLTYKKNGEQNDTIEVQYGDSVKVTSAGEYVKICKKKLDTYGSEINYPISSPGYYSFKTDKGQFYNYGERPLTIPVSDIVKTLPYESAKEDSKAYTGTYFLLVPSKGMYTLTIKVSAFTSKSTNVKQDFETMLKMCAFDQEMHTLLRRAIIRYFPYPVEDTLFYHYGYKPEEGLTELHSGMRLLVEYAMYQNMPSAGKEQKTSNNTSGFVGTGTAAYSVIQRNNKVTFEPFIRTMIDSDNAFEVPELMIEDGSALAGGSGVCDLLFSSLNQPFIRLVYPTQFEAVNYQKNTSRFHEHICIVTADTYSDLITATDTVRKKTAAYEKAHYAYFRGRAVIIPEIQVTVNGQLQWISLGTTVSDLLERQNIITGNVSLKRQSEKGLCSVNIESKGNIPLLIGDCLTVG